MSALFGWLTTGLIVLFWAADFVSCFGATGSRTTAASVATNTVISPRPLRESDDFERLASGEIKTAWSRMGWTSADLDVWIVDNDDINAASFGDGHFVIWRGLRRLSPEVRSAIYAHEFAHDEFQHSTKTREMSDVATWLSEALSTFGASTPEASATLRLWTNQLVLPHYSRSQEREADHEAVRLLGVMGYDQPQLVMCRALVRIRAEVGEAGGGLFASHPAMSERIAQVTATGC